AAAGGALAGGGGDDQFLVRRRLLHLVENALVGGDDDAFVGQVAGGGDELGGGAHGIGHLHHVARGFGVHQDGGVGVEGLQLLEAAELELLVDDTAAVPQQHIGAGLLLHIAAQVLVGGPEDLLPPAIQVVDDIEGDAGGDHPVGPGLHRRRGVGVDHHGAVGVLVAEGGEFLGGAADVQGAGGLEGGHQHALFGGEDLGGLAHELDAAHQQGRGPVLLAEARHFEGIG